MNFKDIHRPYQDGLPDRFTWPFRYCPDQAVRLAAEKVIQHIDSDEGLKAAFSEGKMLGVLVVMTGAGKADDGLLHGLDTENGIFYLAAFSGNAGGRNRISGFVPPIFDTLDPEGHFKKEEAAINAVSEEIERLEGTAALPDEDPGLPVRERIRELKEKRAEQSVRLQEWLFSQYAVRNASGETRSVLDIFADKGLVPPGGTGDCAAPRLLQYAFTHSLEPVSMGEFWYCGEDIAAGPEDPVQEGHSRGRRKGEFCPACSSKCGPLLRWMLTGLDTDNPYAFDDSTVPEILWEDESLMVVSKPAGMLCVPGKDGQKSLVERLPQPCLSVHRLDMDTSGVLLAAKTLRAQSSLQKQFEDRQIGKIYVAVVDNRSGLSEGDSGTIDLPIRPDINDRPRQIVDRKYGKEAVTDYRVTAVSSDRELAVVEFRPLTGRTHQIRVHSALGLGCPVAGDLLYGGSYRRRLYLHAESIRFRHPITGEGMEFSIPSGFMQLLQ